MKKIIAVLSISILLLAPRFSPAESFPDPNLPNGVEHRYRVKYIGGAEESPNEIPYNRKALDHLTLMEYSVRIEHAEYLGKKAYKVVRTERMKNGDTATETMILIRDAKCVFAAEARREHKDPKGRIGKSTFVDLQAPSLGYPKDIAYYMTILSTGGAVALRPKGTVLKCPLYLGDLNLVEATITSMGPETIKVDAKDIKTVKIELSAMLTSYLGDKFWVKPLQKFVPKMSYWFAAEAPNYLVKFEGGFGGPGAPIEVDELIK